jgi:Predicted metal-dependent hydrolase of the TIM-barrel fold
MIIDFHTHCFSEQIVSAAIALLEKNSGLTTNGSSTPENLKQAMRRQGVDISVVLPVATKPKQVPVINRWAKEQTCSSLVFFGAVHPDDPDYDGNLQWIKQHGFKGVKLHPDYIGYYADDPHMFPLYDAIRSYGLILALHAGFDNVYPYPVHCTPLMIRKIIDSFPGLAIVAAHMGSHVLWRDAEELLLGRRLYIDTCYSQYSLSRQDMQRMIGKHGAENVLFGTDSPWQDVEEEIRKIRALSLPPDDIDKILYKNALALLGGAAQGG